jgi:hypothetical protein
MPRCPTRPARLSLNPLHVDLLTLRIAAGNGSIDGHPVASLVAAGFTLLQRSAVLVRALSGGRSGILLPRGALYLTAIAASDGRGAVLFDPNADAEDVAADIRKCGVRAVFTTTRLQRLVPASVPLVLLDDAPALATVSFEGVTRQVDLGSHFGLALEGDSAAPGRDEECIVYLGRDASDPSLEHVLTHRHLIAKAVELTHRDGVANGLASSGGAHENGADAYRRARLWSRHPASGPAALIESFLAPLLAGAHLQTSVHTAD